MSDSKKYEKDDLTVIWNKNLCIHSAKCVQGLGQVFKPEERPWIQVEHASKQEIMDQIDRCPSGALSYAMADNNKEDPASGELQGVIVEVIKNGPLAVKANCNITLADGKTITNEKASFFCRCGGSENKPFCDGTHKRLNFVG